MLVTRPVDTGRNTWSSNKLGALYPHAASPRMSNFEPLPPQPDWREQYSPFPLSGENGLLQPSFEQSSSSNNLPDNHTQSGSARPQLEHRHSIGPLRKESQSTPTIERPDSAPVDSSIQTNSALRNDSLVSTDSTALSLGSLGSNPLSSTSSAPTQQGTLANIEGEDTQPDLKDEDDEDDDDDEMLEADEGSSAVPQTAAERRAERRKMKRFRYISDAF